MRRERKPARSSVNANHPASQSPRARCCTLSGADREAAFACRLERVYNRGNSVQPPAVTAVLASQSNQGEKP